MKNNWYFDNLRRVLNRNAVDFYVYATTIPGVTGANAKFDGDVFTDKDSFFYWTQGSQFAFNSANPQQFDTQYMPDVLHTLRDSITGRMLMSEKCILPAYFGNAVFPMMMPIPYAFAPGDTIECELTNLSGDVPTFDIQLAFIGVKEF